MFYTTNMNGNRGQDMMRDFERASREVAGRLKEFFDGLDIKVERETAGAKAGSRRAPAWSLSDSDDHFTIVVELPGVPKEEIAVTKKGERTIRVAGTRPSATDADRTLRSTRVFGDFDIEIDLPESTEIDGNEIAARHADGLLTITVKKADRVVGRTITVE